MWTTDRSVDEIAVYLEFTEDSVAWTTSKAMPGHKVGRFWKFKREDVDVWAPEGGVAPLPDESSEEEGKDV